MTISNFFVCLFFNKNVEDVFQSILKYAELEYNIYTNKFYQLGLMTKDEQCRIILNYRINDVDITKLEITVLPKFQSDKDFSFFTNVLNDFYCLVLNNINP